MTDEIGAPGAVTVTLTFDEAQQLMTVGQWAGQFRGPEWTRNFSSRETDHVAASSEEKSAAQYRAAEDLIADPDFDRGWMLWCDTYLQAVLVMKVHQGYGYRAHILRDESTPLDVNYTAEDGACVVLTTWHPDYLDEARRP